MNQILDNIHSKSKKKLLASYNKFIFIISLITIFICIILFVFLKYHSYKNEQFSKELINNFNITTLYSSDNSYSAETSLRTFDEPFVIGLLKIDKINLTTPILSYSSDELLSISPCRFYGPMPNEIGNLCIAGHNYANQKHFGKLTSMKVNDTFQIYDLSGNYLDYSIYKIEEIYQDDTSCTQQNYSNLREVTLITCSMLKSTRICIKAKEL